jgi:hypothetical protein
MLLHNLLLNLKNYSYRSMTLGLGVYIYETQKN